MLLFYLQLVGLLIYGSLNRNANLKQYFKNRFLRIYPALWVCITVTVVLLFVFNTINTSSLLNKQFCMGYRTINYISIPMVKLINVSVLPYLYCLFFFEFENK